jgi:hypothetical protein
MGEYLQILKHLFMNIVCIQFFWGGAYKKRKTTLIFGITLLKHGF